MPVLQFVKLHEERGRNAAGFLFSTYSLAGTLKHQMGALDGEIDGYSTEYLLNVDDDKLYSYLEAKYLIEYPGVNYSGTQLSETAAKIDVSQDWRRDIWDRSRPSYVDGIAVTFHLPLVGQPELFDSSPNVVFMGSGGPPKGRVSDGEVHLTYTAEHVSAERFQQQFERDKEQLNRVLQYVCQQISEFNELARARMRTRVSDRRSRISALTSGLKFPLRVREQGESTASAIQSKLLPPKAYTEPALQLRQYNEVLQALENAATALERAPSAFARMTEEEIRHHFLIALNTVYHGNASAETFNAGGKTDILIRVEGKTIFVGECKFWRGKRSFVKAIDQLLGYVSWRDTKTALIILNRGGKLSSVLGQIPNLVRQHANYVRDDVSKDETSLKFVMHHKDDVSREILLAVLVFEVPAQLDR